MICSRIYVLFVQKTLLLSKHIHQTHLVFDDIKHKYIFNYNNEI